jgi:hypothetical protein
MGEEELDHGEMPALGCKVEGRRAEAAAGIRIGALI